MTILRSLCSSLGLFVLIPLSVICTNAQPPPSNNQDDPAVALLRHKSDFTTIETIVDAKLAPRTSPTVTVYQLGSYEARQIASSSNVDECYDQYLSGKICRETTRNGKLKFVYRLSGPPADVSKYLVGFSIVDGTKGEIERLLRVSLDFKTVSPEIEIIDPDQRFVTENGVRAVSDSNGVIRIPVVFPDPDNEAFEAYIDERITAIYEWIRYMIDDPESFATVKVESLSKNREPEVFKVSGVKITPEDMDDAIDANRLTIQIVPAKKFPSEGFVYEVMFQDAENRDDPASIRKVKPPAEIAGRLLNESNGIKNVKKASAKRTGRDRTLSLRDFKNNLDVGLAFRSYVEEDEDSRGRTFRERINIGYLDVRYAPIIDRPGYQKGVNHLFTPFFLDAKISNGRIKKRTLSRNRVLFGTEYSLRWIPSTKRGKINKYIFSFRGINASDRDFKRMEGKFNFEFRPLFDRLNQPLEIRYREPASILDPGTSKRIATNWFGYQVQPFVGTEIGRVYRARRDAFENEESSRNIRRLYAGMDVLLNVTKHLNIRLTDTYYYRNEVSAGRTKNFFMGELDAPLFLFGQGSQSIFVRYERGDEPPFASPSVNSFRIGYRFSTNVLGRSP